MPRPQFITCQLCGKGFGSASINIHIPQCYEKALKRWKLDPMGPRPVMPPLHGGAGGGQLRKTTTGGNGNGAVMASGTVGFEDQPCGGGVSAVRSLHSQNVPSPTDVGAANMNLHPCSKCGRSFNFDRIAYHESVCKGDQKRKVFDSSKQRRASGEDDDGFGSIFGRPSGGKGMKKKKGGLGVANTTSRYTPAPAPQTNWRQQHEEFINAIRSAKRADAESQSMWGTSGGVAVPSRAPMAPPPRGSQNAPFQRSTNVGGAGAKTSTMARGMPPPSQRVPPLMTKQSESRKQNIATGGRAAKAKSSAPMAPPQPRDRMARPGNRGAAPQRNSFGSGGDRFGGRSYGGGGGGGRILNDNTTSVGMLQALGQA